MSITEKIHNCGQSTWNSLYKLNCVKAIESFYERVKEVVNKVLDFTMPRNPVTKKHEFRLIPICLENALGSVAIKAICPDSKIVKNEDTKIVEKVFAKLVANCDRPELKFEVRVMDSSLVNAMCVPGGKVIITTALIEKLKQETNYDFQNPTFEDKLAAVLSHEITHACASHSAKTLQLKALMAIIGKVGSVALGIFVSKKMENQSQNEKLTDKEKIEAIKTKNKTVAATQKVFDTTWSIGNYFLQHHHSLEHELEADKYGIKYIKKAGYNPYGAVWIQHKFLEMEGHKDGDKRSLEDRVQDLFSTHPPSQERLDANRKTIEKMEKEGIEKAFA